MNRKLIGTLVLSGLLFFLLIASLNVAQAAPTRQDTQQAGDTADAADEEVIASEVVTAEIDTLDAITMGVGSEPLTEPIQITIRQRLPISVDLGQLGLSSEGVTITGALPLELELTIDFLVTDTMTSTVPSTVTLMNVGDLLTRLPVSITLGTVTNTLVVMMPQKTEVLTATVALTETEAITSPPDITVTATVTPEIEATPTATATPPITESDTLTQEVTSDATATPVPPEIAPTSSVTANLRAGPGTTFDLVGTSSPGQELEIVAISNDAQWYLLASGQWIFSELVSDPPADLPVATQEIIDEVNRQAEAQAAATPEATATPRPTATPRATAEPTEEATPETPTPAPTATPIATPVSPVPSANVDANLRSGPGTQFDIIGGTITGQELDIVGQNSTGEWYLLSNGGWISANLVNNAPSAVPVVADDASPILSGDPLSPILVPTPVPGASTPEAPEEADEQVLLGLAENLYLDEVRTLIARYDLAGDAVLRLVTAVQSDGALLVDTAWQEEMNTAIATIRRTGQQIRSLEPPALFAAAQIDLRSATGAFDLAATLLEEGVSEGALDKLDQALAETETGNALVQSAQAKVNAVAQ